MQLLLPDLPFEGLVSNGIFSVRKNIVLDFMDHNKATADYITAYMTYNLPWAH